MQQSHIAVAGPADLPPAPAPAHTPFHVSVEAGNGFSMQRMCRLRHDYDRHPLMQLDRLEALAQALMPLRQCRFIKPGTTDASEFDHANRPPDGRDLADVFRRLHEPGSWIALYNVQHDPLYRDFLWDVLRSAGLDGHDGEKAYDARGFVFISAPPSVTPFHIDRENNLWLQIRGRKTLSVWDHRDRGTVAARDVESFINTGSLRNVRLTDAARPRATAFDCGPGDGVYFPSTSPHMTHTETSWVTPDDAVSISIGVVFYTNRTRRTARAHACNSVLRRLGLDPALAGSSAWLDGLKQPFGRAVIGWRKLRGSPPPPGF